MTNSSPEKSNLFLERRSQEIELEWVPQTPLTRERSTVIEIEWLPEIRRDDLIGLIGTKFARIVAKNLYKIADSFTRLSGDSKT